jgi:hypothetical protein
MSKSIHFNEESLPKMAVFPSFFDEIAPRLRRGEGFELDVSPGCENLGPGQTCLIGCRWPFLGRVVAAQCPVGNTDRFQVGMVV